MSARWSFAFLLASGVAGLHLVGEDSDYAGVLIQDSFEQRAANPAGCAVVGHDDRIYDPTFLSRDGVYPIEDFKEMFGHTFAHRQGGIQRCMEPDGPIARSRWCFQNAQEPYLGRGSEVFQALQPYLTGALEGTDTSLPLTVAVYDFDPTLTTRSDPYDSRAVQALNFLCGWERLGILDNRSAIFVGTEEIATELRALNPRARVLYHPRFSEATSLIMNRTRLVKPSRVWKLMVAQLLLNLQRDLLMTDMDAYFVRDPVPMLAAAAQRDGLEFAAMKDWCWLEVNSGFAFFRNTPKTRTMLEIALTTRNGGDEENYCTDDDQYLLNCAFARAAMDGLNYRILPRSGFSFLSMHPRNGGRILCRNTSEFVEESWPYDWRLPPPWHAFDGLPYVWHTSGFTDTYDAYMDHFAALGAIDVDTSTRRCLAGARGLKRDALKFAHDSAMSCYTGEGGILHARCTGGCELPPERWEKLKEGFRSAQ